MIGPRLARADVIAELRRRQLRGSLQRAASHSRRITSSPDNECACEGPRLYVCVITAGWEGVCITHLDSLVLERLVGVVHVLERDAVELPLVDVGDAVVLAPLRRAGRRLQVVLEPVRREPADITHGFRTHLSNIYEIVYLTTHLASYASEYREIRNFYKILIKR